MVEYSDTSVYFVVAPHNLKRLSSPSCPPSGPLLPAATTLNMPMGSRQLIGELPIEGIFPDYSLLQVVIRAYLISSVPFLVVLPDPCSRLLLPDVLYGFMRMDLT